MPAHRRYSSPAAVYHSLSPAKSLPQYEDIIIETPIHYSIPDIPAIERITDVIIDTQLCLPEVIETLATEKIIENKVEISFPPTTITFEEQMPQSSSIHVDLRKLPANHPLVVLKQKAVDNASRLSIKHHTRNKARQMLQKALSIHESTKSVVIGHYFYWSNEGLYLNFTTDAQKWLAIDNQDWLFSISPKLSIIELWKAMFIRGVDYLTQTEDFEVFTTICYKYNKLDTGCEYRIRKVRRIGKYGLAVWFHHVGVLEQFLKKGVWYMDSWCWVDGEKRLVKNRFGCLDEFQEQSYPMYKQVDYKDRIQTINCELPIKSQVD